MSGSAGGRAVGAVSPRPLHRVSDVDGDVLWSEFQPVSAHLRLNGISSCAEQRKDRRAADYKCEFNVKFHMFSFADRSGFACWCKPRLSNNLVTSHAPQIDWIDCKPTQRCLSA